MKIEIKDKRGSSILFSHEVEGNTLPLTLMLSNQANTDLSGADLNSANLSNANLCGANLNSANLRDADLSGANLCGANLNSANLSNANLCGADLSVVCLRNANLSGADLSGATIDDGATLIGRRPILQVGPIGSRDDYLVAYSTDKGLRLDAGCQHQISRDAFEARLQETHENNIYAKEYRAALLFIDAWVGLG